MYHHDKCSHAHIHAQNHAPSERIHSFQQCQLTRYFSRNNSVLALALLHNTHTTCTTGTNQIDTQLRLTYSRNLIQIHNYTYLLTKSELLAFRLVQNFILQSQLCVLILIRCPFEPRVSAVASKRTRSFWEKYTSQVTSISTHFVPQEQTRSIHNYA